MEVNSGLTGKRGVSLPFTDECEPIGFNEEAFQSLLKQVGEYGRERRWKYWEIRGGASLLSNSGPGLSFYTHSLDLTPGAARVFDGFESSVRRAIRRAERSTLSSKQISRKKVCATFTSSNAKRGEGMACLPSRLPFF